MIIDFAIDLGSLSILLLFKNCYQKQTEDTRMSAVSCVGRIMLPWPSR